LSARILIDTHVVLWMLLDPANIPDKTLELVRDPGTELLISAASAWEIGTKYRLGKLADAHAVVHGYAGHLARLRATELPISAHHALTAGLLSWEHRDPFDRVIAAQALLESVPLVTTDRALAAFPGIQVIW
jgi:PIN domain nuclease of toxin-antitoxin system